MTEPNWTKTLLVEDEEGLRDMLQKVLEHRGHEVLAFGDAESAWDAYQRQGFPLVILDWGLPGRMDGLELCRKIRGSERGGLSVVMAVTARNRPEDLRRMLDAGADDYTVKPVDMKVFDVRLTIAERRTRDLLALFETKAKQGRGDARNAFQDFVGSSAVMQDVYSRLELAADSDLPVLILGESGTGKELAARAIHTLSRRKDKPFLGINCAAIPETLLESELFGHVKGAFTGAAQDKTGIFMASDGGTLFLDEIGDMPASLQLKLLRVLEEKEIRRLGETRDTKVDVRLVTATNRNLKDLIASGKMREDFYYRIHVVEISLPPLRDRREDIPLLVDHALSEFARTQNKSLKGIARDALQRLIDHPWPGNVRQLQHAIGQACVTTHGDELTPADFPPEILQPPEPRPASKPALSVEKEADRLHIIEALKKAGGSRSGAAKILGISRISLWRRMKKLDIDE